MASAPPLIGVVGKKRAGKDTIAAALVEVGWTRIALADPLREAALGLDPLVGEVYFWKVGDSDPATHRNARLSEVVASLGWEKAKDYVPEVRRTLQRLGADAIRELDPGFWVRQAERSILASAGPVVVPDVRFPNEVAMIRALGGTIVRVVRPETEVDDPHPSETALDGFAADVTLHNLTTVEDLAYAARYLGERAAA